MRKLFVWDFHGVLEKGTERAVHEISNHALAAFGYTERFSQEACDAHYGKKWYLYFQALMPDLALEKCYELQRFCNAYSGRNPHITEQYIQPHPFAHAVLSSIASQGHSQILISNAHFAFLMHYLKLLKLDQFFDQISANGGDEFNQSREKVDVLETYLDANPDHYQQIIAIDDLPDNLTFKKVPDLKFCLYRHAPPFPDCSADYFTHDLQEVVNCFSYEKSMR